MYKYFLDFQIICVAEACLNDMCFDHKRFPDVFTIFLSDRVSSSKSMAGGVLWRFSLEFETLKADGITIL